MYELRLKRAIEELDPQGDRLSLTSRQINRIAIDSPSDVDHVCRAIARLLEIYYEMRVSGIDPEDKGYDNDDYMVCDLLTRLVGMLFTGYRDGVDASDAHRRRLHIIGEVFPMIPDAGEVQQGPLSRPEVVYGIRLTGDYGSCVSRCASSVFVMSALEELVSQSVGKPHDWYFRLIGSSVLMQPLPLWAIATSALPSSPRLCHESVLCRRLPAIDCDTASELFDSAVKYHSENRVGALAVGDEGSDLDVGRHIQDFINSRAHCLAGDLEAILREPIEFGADPFQDPLFPHAEPLSGEIEDNSALARIPQNAAGSITEQEKEAINANYLLWEGKNKIDMNSDEYEEFIMCAYYTVVSFMAHPPNGPDGPD